MGGGDQLCSESDRGALMRIAFIIGAGMLLVSCTDEIGDQKSRIEIVDRSKDRQAMCSERRKLQELYLKAKDEKGYTDAKLDADINCRLASYDGQGHL